ncbi:MAG: oxidoreductase, partial [Candidatus Acidiferrales bacterium]
MVVLREPAEKNQLQVALIGYGMAAKVFHAPLISSVSGLRLSHIVSSKPDVVKQDWPDAKVLARPAEAFSNPEIDLIVVATPNDSHCDLAQRALGAGKHVVVDKPFTTSVAEAAELAALAKKTGRVLSIFHNRRWDGDFLTLRALISEGRLGEVLHFESHYDRYRPLVRKRWREQPGPASGIWYDLGPHLIDQALQLFGTPEGIRADLEMQREGAQTVDYFHVVLRYGRARVILHASSLVRGDLPRFIVHGRVASYVKYGMDSQEEALKRGERPGGADWGVDPRDGTLILRDGNTEAETSAAVPTARGNYRGYYEAVRDAILRGAANPATPEYGVLVMRVLEAGVESSAARGEIAFGLAADTT